MVSCPGRKDNGKHACNAYLERCKKCGNIGCYSNRPGECTNQAFANSGCLKCGAIGNRETFK